MLQSIAGGPPVEEVAEMFEVELDQLKKVAPFYRGIRLRSTPEIVASELTVH